MDASPYLSPMPSLKLSVTGVQIIKQARKEKGWTIDHPCWLEAASQILEPARNWENAEVFANGVSLFTWKRFLKGDAIDASVFKAILDFIHRRGFFHRVMVRRDCNSSEFVFSPSDRCLKCQF